ncbi:DUF5615 family PIN-like protein [Halalkalicoccus sp. NIPERK01]|uniref:DUF5615 family PIN-like protein n=1 Tax=Halalkalicoccus sp. NIPERK01 TaxID=3053469 RepID=UPI00256F3BD1|nr:DUF5615 family PIN-like protein [Halalkalicoccus sp. NIPERK01]MDL5362322.1 DUF5615 family PIN-like protein [Halalkalicoccus sp. NIPERK01]
MIYADENVWIPVVEGLRRRDWDVTTTLEEETLGYTDEEHMEYAREREWAVLTFDDDFLSLVETENADPEHPGVIYASQHGRSVGDLVKRIDAVLQRHDDRDLSGEVVFA